MSASPRTDACRAIRGMTELQRDNFIRYAHKAALKELFSDCAVSWAYWEIVHRLAEQELRIEVAL